jgi:hypothetical protein
MAPPTSASLEIPATYRCSDCTVHGCKLWRGVYNAFLMCSDCAALNEEVDITGIDVDGRYFCPLLSRRTDIIGGQVPAVPNLTAPGTYWDHENIPADAYAWWRGLPTRPSACW